MSARFREAKNGYVKSEVDSYILRLENDIETYQFEEKKQEQELLEAKRQAEKIILSANKKSAEILARVEAESVDINASISSAVHKIGSFQNSFESLAHTLLIEKIAETDIRPTLNNIKMLDYEISRKIIFLESMSAALDPSDEYSSAATPTSPNDRVTEYESRLLLQKKVADKPNYAVVIPLLIIIFIAVYIIFRHLI